MATSFSPTAVNWSVPDAGLTTGFYRPHQDSASGGRWSSVDIDGDSAPDLVLTTDNGDATFGSAANMVWKVYLAN